MIHQRTVIWIMRIVTFIAVIYFWPYIAYIGHRLNVWTVFIVGLIVWIPVEILIKKLFPAPDWYGHEDEGPKMTSLNLTSTKTAKNGDQNAGQS